MKVEKNEKGQAVANPSVPVTEDAFLPIKNTTVRWLGSAGSMINTRGTIILIDPVLEGFDMPLIYEVPLAPKDVRKVDGYLVTHKKKNTVSASGKKKITADIGWIHPMDLSGIRVTPGCCRNI